MGEKNRLVVKIASREYTILSEADSDYIYRTAAAVDREMSEIMSSNSRISVDMASVLVALNAKDFAQRAAETVEELKTKLSLYDDSTDTLLAKVKELEEQNAQLKVELEQKEKDIQELLEN